jgi:hypothetical protein
MPSRRLSRANGTSLDSVAARRDEDRDPVPARVPAEQQRRSEDGADRYRVDRLEEALHQRDSQSSNPLLSNGFRGLRKAAPGCSDSPSLSGRNQ